MPDCSTAIIVITPDALRRPPLAYRLMSEIANKWTLEKSKVVRFNKDEVVEIWGSSLNDVLMPSKIEAMTDYHSIVMAVDGFKPDWLDGMYRFAVDFRAKNRLPTSLQFNPHHALLEIHSIHDADYHHFWSHLWKNSPL